MNFLERIREQVLVGDGAMGTMFYSKGVRLDAGFERLNLTEPQLVLELHVEYIAAGAQVIETNTFAANRQRLAQFGLDDRVREINLQGAVLARRAVAGNDVFVAGSLGPLPRFRGEGDGPLPDDVYAAFHEQAAALVEGGVDLLLLETFADLEQLQIALAVARQFGLPVIASMAFLERGRIPGGMTVERVAQELAAAGADCLGANCGAGTLEMTRNIQRMASATQLPLAAYANSGFPEYVDGRYLYRTTPDYFAERALETAQAGANLVGGCCGTTPDHIRLLAQRLRGMRPTARTIAVAAPAEPDRPEPPATGGFLAGWGRKTVITVELDPPKGLDCRRLLEGCRVLQDAGADAINLAENPLSRVRLGNIALAELIQREVGIEVIAHITCRDRNLIGLQSDLLGASLLGIRSILAVTGDPASMGEQSGASSVFDVNSLGLITLLRELNAGRNGTGNAIDRGTGFTIGAAFNPNLPNMAPQVARLRNKVANGARFVQTQPVFDLERLETMLRLTADLGVPILPGILPLVSERNTEFLHNEVPGIVIPEAIRARMRGKGKEEGVREGLAIAREFIAEARNLVGGFYLIPPFGNFQLAAELVRYLREG
jgi:methionine synthase / methylenetetrahydrofolate reductase(NADPH)